jgi:hypothetical protein
MTTPASSIKDPATSLPFTPHPTESQKAFDCFLCYLDIGENRSLTRVADLTKVNHGTIKYWSRHYQWAERIHAYQAHILRTRLQIETAAVESVSNLWAERTATYKEREWAAAEKLLALAQRSIDVLQSKDPDKITLTDVAKALDIATKIGRLSLGLATQKTEHTTPEIRIEVNAALDKIYGEPLPGEIIDVSAVPDKPNQLPE